MVGIQAFPIGVRGGLFSGAFAKLVSFREGICFISNSAAETTQKKGWRLEVQDSATFFGAGFFVGSFKKLEVDRPGD